MCDWTDIIKNLPRLWLVAVLVACFAVLGQGEVSAIDKTSLEIDVQSFFDNYQEAGGSLNGQSLNSTENGLLNGLRLSYMRTNPDSDRDFRINALLSFGNTTYAGNYPNEPATGVSNNLIMAIEVLTMYDYIQIIESQLYFGLGYRRWQLGLCSVSSKSSVSEAYSWLYVPVGLRHSHEFSSDLSCEIDFSARMMLAGRFSASDLQVNGQICGVDMALGSQYGVDLRVPFAYKLSKEFALVVTPWIDYSQMGASNSANISGTSYQLIEPPNSTWQFGADLGLRYTF